MHHFHRRIQTLGTNKTLTSQEWGNGVNFTLGWSSELSRCPERRGRRATSGEVPDLEGEEADPQPPALAAPTESRKTKEEQHRLHGAWEETERPRDEPDPTVMNGDKAQGRRATPRRPPNSPNPPVTQ